ncbi:unnamed protein product, partial [Symbiodinium sp. KB8]
MTTVRADIGNLLQYRAKPPPPPQKPPPRKEGKGKDSKGGGKTKHGTQPGKRKEPGTGTAPEVKTSDLVKEHGGRAAVVVKWAGGRCRDGQPFRLNLLHSIALSIADKDAQLPLLLDQGVPTGAFEPLPSSGQWAQAPHSIDASTDLQGPHLEHCRGNWTAAEQSPELLAQLIQQEVEKGFVKCFEGTEEDAALQWPKGTAIGKLNVVIAEGRDPRLVLDNTVCGLNPAVHIPERVALPTASDVQRTFLAEDCYAQQTALSIDFKAAHKCNKVHPSEHGTLLFRQGTALYYYTVCHFGARFSAYWWQRTGGLILRSMHALLGRYPHKAWLYVDDLLCVLRTAQSEQGAALIIALLAALHAPISWKKAQFSTSVTWEQLHALQRKSKIPRKELEAVLGTLHSIAPAAWQAFYDCLDATAQLSRTPTGSWLPRNGRVLEVTSTFAKKANSSSNVSVTASRTSSPDLFAQRRCFT